MISVVPTLLYGLTLAQTPVQPLQIVLYTPAKTVAEQKISLQGWGNGTISETDELAFQGSRSLRVSTRNFFHGGRISFGDPQDMSQAYENKKALLRVAFYIPGERLTLGNQGAQDTGRTTVFLGDNVVTDLRLVITTSDGLLSEIFIPLDSTIGGDRSWRTAAFPLSAIHGFERTNKMIQNISVSANTTVSMYVGDLRLFTDETPIKGQVVGPTTMNLALGDEVTLRAAGMGGSSVLKYVWDFDDADGIQSEAEGQTVRRKFRKAGTFKVTCTISDLYGLKAPLQLTLNVKVNP